MSEVFAKRLISLLFALLLAMGCASARLIAADGPLVLKPNQGILVVHVDSDFPIRRLRFDSVITAASDLGTGEYVALAVVPAGDYHWTTIEVPISDGVYFYRFRMRRDSNWNFKVEAGRINYPGQIIVRGSARSLFRNKSLHAWTENRSALALEQLRLTYPTLISQYPLTNGRSERDDFLEHYQRIAPFISPKTPKASPN
jgi:hypothetical protein